MLQQMTLWDTATVISSPESQAGHLLPSSPAGRTTANCGLAPVHANHSARLELGLALTIPATFGPPGSISSRSVVLAQSLANRLRERLASPGSIWFGHKWKLATTPSRRSICRLVASAHPIPGNEFTLWRTPTSTDCRDRGHIGNPSVQRRMRLGKQIGLSMLFQGTPCPFCVAATMGYPMQWARCMGSGTPSSPS